MVCAYEVSLQRWFVLKDGIEISPKTGNLIPFSCPWSIGENSDSYSVRSSFRSKAEKDEQKEVAGRAIEPTPVVTFEPQAAPGAVDQWGGDAGQWTDTPVAAPVAALAAAPVVAAAPAGPTDWAAEAVSPSSFLLSNLFVSSLWNSKELICMFFSLQEDWNAGAGVAGGDSWGGGGAQW